MGISLCSFPECVDCYKKNLPCLLDNVFGIGNYEKDKTLVNDISNYERRIK